MIKAPFHWSKDADLAFRIFDANKVHVATIDPGMPLAHQEASARAITNALNLHATVRPINNADGAPLVFVCPSCNTTGADDCKGTHGDGFTYLICNACHYHWLKPTFQAAVAQ